MSDFTLLISVVVIGRNEGSRLERCLKSIIGMQLSGFQIELIYVDSGSTDNSVEIAGKLGAATIALSSPHPTAALGRNAGWRIARGSFVLFLDGDTILDRRFVLDSLPDFEDKTAVVWGHRRELFPSASIFHRVLDLDWMYAAGKTSFCGGDALFRRDILDLTGGFDPDLIAGEEPELCRRILQLGYVILHVDRPMTAHDLGMTRFSQYWLRATRAGHAFAEISDRFASSPNPFWRRESRGNETQALLSLLIVAAAAVESLVFASLWPSILSLVAFSLVVFRTAWRARWKTRNWAVLLLYGGHSHLQQIPIYWGQLRYRFNRQRGRRTSLVEYKGPAN